MLLNILNDPENQGFYFIIPRSDLLTFCPSHFLIFSLADLLIF